MVVKLNRASDHKERRAVMRAELCDTEPNK